MSGHFGIGVYQGKHHINLGVLWRGAFQLGAAYIFTIGERYKKDSGDVYKTWLRVPLFQFGSFDEMKQAAPRDCPIVAIESGGTPLPSFEHPLRAVYLLGAEDGGIPRNVIEQCHRLVTIPSIRTDSYNVAQAGTITLYDRMVKLDGAGIEPR